MAGEENKTEENNINKTGNKVTKAGLYICKEHPDKQIELKEGDEFPICENDGHQAEWVEKKDKADSEKLSGTELIKEVDKSDSEKPPVNEKLNQNSQSTFLQTTNSEFEDLSWFGENEKTFAEKLILYVGGIVSFAGLFPIFLNNFSLFDKSAEKGVFWFNILYFLSPLGLLLIWLLLSGRLNNIFKFIKIFKRESQIESTHNNYTQSIYLVAVIILLIQILLSILLIYITFKNAVTPNIGRYYLIFGLFILVTAFAFSFCVIKFKNLLSNKYKPTLIVAGIFTVLYLIAGAVYFFKIDSTKEKKLIDIRPEKVDSVFSKIPQIHTLADHERDFERLTLNIAERYAVKSKLTQSALIYNSLDSVDTRKVDSISHEIKIRIGNDISPYLRIFNIFLTNKRKLMINDSSNINIDNFFNNYEYPLKYVNNVKNDDSANTNFIKFLKNDKFYNIQTLLSKIDSSDDCRKKDDFIVINRMRVISDLIYSSLDNDKQLANTNAINDSLTSIYSSIGKLPSFRNKNLNNRKYLISIIAAKINVDNSRYLSEWLKQAFIYIKYSTNEKINTTLRESKWIFDGIIARGILIYGAFLYLLVIVYILLNAIVSSYISKINNKEKNTNLSLLDKELEGKNEEEREAILKKLKEKISAIKQYKDYKLYPFSALMAIIVTLFIPLIQIYKPDEALIDKANWYLGIPNWNITKYFDGQASKTFNPDNIKLECNCKCNPNITVTGGSLDKETLREIKENTSSINKKLDCNN